MVIKVKYNGEWVKIPYLSVNEDSGVNYVEEAPKDGNQYTRKDGVWTVLNIPDDITETINNKVDKVDGKDLSTNDYTNADKTKVDNLTSVLVDADIAQTEFAATITLDKIDLSTGTTSDVEIELPASTTVLSGLMTAADKTKLNSIAVGAEVNVNADWNSTGGDSQILNKPDLTKHNNLPTWVFDAVNLNTEEGDDYITVHGTRKNLETGETSEIGSTIYVASSEHIGYMSPADKTILDGLAANAITSTEVDQKINSAIASVYKIKGTVANYEALPTTDVTIGDVYNLEDTGANYVATSTTPTWDKLSETVDLSAYSTTEQNDSKYQPKGNYLTSVPSEYVTDTELNNKNYATKTEIPTKVSQLTNDSKYLTTTPVATNSTIGGIMLGYSENNKNYAVKISSNKAYVTVPWVNTTYSNATTSAAGLMSSTDKRKLDGLNNYTLTQATSSALGGIKIGYTENGKNYPVELSNGKAFVNVPWTDTNTTYSNATTSTAGLLSAADKTKLDSIDLVGEKGSVGLIKNGSSVTSFAGYTACPIVDGVPYYKELDALEKSKLDVIGVDYSQSTVTNISIKNRITYIELNSSKGLQIASFPGGADEILIIIKNTGSRDITITMFPTYICMNGNSITIPSGKFGEISAIPVEIEGFAKYLITLHVQE